MAIFFWAENHVANIMRFKIYLLRFKILFYSPVVCLRALLNEMSILVLPNFAKEQSTHWKDMNLSNFMITTDRTKIIHATINIYSINFFLFKTKDMASRNVSQILQIHRAKSIPYIMRHWSVDHIRWMIFILNSSNYE